MDELIRRFNNRGVRYLVFGGQAVRLVGMPRFSMDWDLFIPGRDLENMNTINALLDDELDMPLIPVGPGGENLIQTYQTSWGIVQFHLAVAGIMSFDEVESRSVVYENENGTRIRCFSLDDLIASKEAVARPQDLSDVQFLKMRQKVLKS
jgi:hypothetical protein